MATIPGSNSDNFLFGTEDGDEILGRGGNDLLLGFGGADLLLGGNQADQLDGGDGSDTLRGGNGNDTLFGDSSFSGTLSADVLTGGGGVDTFGWSVAPGAHSTSVLQDTVTDLAGGGSPAGDILFLSDPAHRLVFEGAVAVLPAIGATLPFGGNGFTEVFYGFDGTDTVLFADSDDNGVFDGTDFAVRITGVHNLIRADFGDTDFVIRGTDGPDTIVGGLEDDTVFGLDGRDSIVGGEGGDSISGGGGSDNLNGDAGNDQLFGGAGLDVLIGGIGRDLLVGDAGDDRLEGNADDDRLAGGSGNDVAFGDAGNDDLDGDEGNDQLVGGTGDDDFFGGTGNDTAFGQAGDDELFGDAGNDSLSGGDGADTLEGDAGADRLAGGAGNDEFVFFLGGFNASSTFAASDTVRDFQGAGAPGGDEIALENESAPLVFRGEISLDPVLGALLPGAGNGVHEVVFTVQGGVTWLLIDENDNGVLNSQDTAIKFSGSRAFTEDDFTSGTDFVMAGTPDGDSISGGPDDDVIFGLAGNDFLFGLDGNDTLDGGAGRDVLDGGPGFDELRGGAGADTLTLQDSNLGGNASGGAGNDLLIGSDALFALVSLAGDAGNDTLQAGASGDTNLVGGDGNDRLEGGAGDDQFTGGAGLDKFVFGPVWTSASGFTDIIWDFEDGVEKIDLRGSGLTESDVTIGDDGFSAIITSVAGRIEVSGLAGQITSDDFLFA